jgi:hypothetical protein
LESIKKSKARASGSNVPSSCASQPEQPAPVGGDLNKEASDTLPVVANPPASSSATCIQHQTTQNNGVSNAESSIVRCARFRIPNIQRCIVLFTRFWFQALKARAAESATSGAAQSENVYAVDRIVGQKKVNGCDRFRVRWEGFSPQDDTWEPADNISDIVRCSYQP